MQDITVFWGESFCEPHKYVRSILQCEPPCYVIGSCVCILLKQKVLVEGKNAVHYLPYTL